MEPKKSRINYSKGRRPHVRPGGPKNQEPKEFDGSEWKFPCCE